MGSRALSVESAEEGASLLKKAQSGESKSFRFLQILSAANKQYAGAYGCTMCPTKAAAPAPSAPP